MSEYFQIDNQAITDFLLRLLATRSYSTEESAAAQVLAEELAGFGFEVEVDDVGSVVGALVLGDGPTVLLDSHLDTVVVVDPTEWTRNPEGEIAAGRAYGRGAVDMKGPLAACVHGVAALRGLGVGKIVISGTVAEELVEGPALVRVAERVQPDFVVICEASAGRIAAGQRGRAELCIEVEGRSSHSAFPQVGLNAAEVMADVIAALRSVEGPTHPTLGEGILVLTDVMSQPYPGLSVVPERCVATYDRRTLVGETEEDVLRPVRTVVEAVTARWGTHGTVSIATDEYAAYTGTQIQAPNFAPAWLTAQDSVIVTAAMEGLRSAGLDAVVSHYRFCTNGSGTAGHLGIPTIGYGPGEEDQPHTVDESIALADLHAGARGYAAIVSALLRHGSTP
ncbi:YgeY family selenium metabolism-linked hydrolase [Micromonospora sp. NPDC048830]|uniref:YgeY family selenium metabolism-linked hydrolase n=1 Tax=Micromonospora sp. NPDC048830 TaxID=3364257 RepID=UPI00371C966B